MNQRLLVGNLSGGQTFQIFHRGDLALHQQIVQGLHGGDLAPVRSRARIQANGKGNLLQDREVKGNYQFAVVIGVGDLHIPLSVVFAHELHVDAAQILNALQKVLLRQLHGGCRRPLQGDNGGGVVRSGIAQRHVRCAEKLLRVADGNINELADLGGDAGGVNDLRHALHTAVYRNGSADLVCPLGYLGGIVYHLRIGQRHKGDHGHGEQFVYKDLVGQQTCNHGLSVIAVLHIVPVHPRQGIQLDAEVQIAPDLRLPGALVGVDGAGLVILP